MTKTRTQNLLLAALSNEDWQLIEPNLKAVDLTRGQLLFDRGEDVVRTYFPSLGTIISLMVPLRDGHVVEATMIGYEGAAGGVVSAGNKPASGRIQVLRGGGAWCTPTATLEDLKWKSQNLHDVFSRYGDLLLAQTMQSVACNSVHTIEQRFCRWLLSLQDRVPDRHLDVTQEVLAGILGVQRTTISGVARSIQQRRIIEYNRGRILIRDREALRGIACECYDDTDSHLAAILPGIVDVRKAQSWPLG